MTDDSTDDRPEQDRRQIILPHVDTSPSIRGKTLREWMAYFPVILGLCASVIAFLLGAVTVAGVFLGITVFGLVFLGVHIESELSEAWYLTPRGVVKEYLSSRRLKRQLPWGADAAKYAALHGVRHVCEDGSYKRHDGSRLALVGPIQGVNADRRPATVMQQLATQLTNGVDEKLGPNGLWWGIHSTTRLATSDPYADECEQRAEDYQNDLTPTQRDIVDETGQWLREQDERFDGNEWRHYAVVESRPSEPGVALPDKSLSARMQGVRASLSTVGSRLSELRKRRNDTENAGPNDERTEVRDGEQPDSVAATPQVTVSTTEHENTEAPLDEVLDRRVALITQAIGRVEDVELTRADASEHIEVLRSYWTNRGTAIGHDGNGSSVSGGTDSLLQQAFHRDLDIDGVTPTERLLAPGQFDISGNTVELAGSCCRTFWISQWPVRPSAMFLERLYTYAGVDLDVRIRARPRDRQAAATDIEDKGLDIGAETINRTEQSSFGELTVGSAEDAYKDAYYQLHNTNVDAWSLNGYVTVRARDRDMLDDACSDLVQRLEANPTGCSLVTPQNQAAALASASPASRDQYADKANGKRRHLALSGAFGAIFPFGVAEYTESDGIYWGRDTRTNRPVIANLFSGGTASHLFTIGMSRTGKTTFVKDRLGNWHHGGDDRTLVVADTEVEFSGLTDVCGGKQIVIGASDPINPWHIEPVSTERRQKANDKLAPLTAQIDFITELTMNIIRVGLSPTETVDSNLYGFVRYAVAETYHRAGITDDLDTHGNDSPTYDDFFSVLGEIRNDPGKHTFLGTDGECQARIDLVDTLLNSLIEMLEGAGRYAHLRGKGKTALLDDTVRMAYLSMPGLSDTSAAAKSIGLQLALHQISEKVKRTPGPTLFAIDEAHVLYQNEETINWLQSAARRWARYEAAMWSISQSPEEFVKSLSGTTDKQENKRQMILEQSATLQAFYSPKTDPETLAKFGMEPPQISAVKNDLTPGRNNDHSTCLVQFDDLQGWIECRVETSPFTDAIEATIEEMGDDETEGALDRPTLTTIDGLDRNTATQLRDGGIETPADLLQTTPQEVAALTNAGGERIDDWYAAAVGRNGTASQNGN